MCISRGGDSDCNEKDLELETTVQSLACALSVCGRTAGRQYGRTHTHFLASFDDGDRTRREQVVRPVGEQRDGEWDVGNKKKWQHIYETHDWDQKPLTIVCSGWISKAEGVLGQMLGQRTDEGAADANPKKTDKFFLCGFLSGFGG